MLLFLLMLNASSLIPEARCLSTVRIAFELLARIPDMYLISTRSFLPPLCFLARNSYLASLILELNPISLLIVTMVAVAPVPVLTAK